MKRLLAARGLTTAEAAEAFLKADLGTLSDPFLLSGVPEAVDRIVRAIHRGEEIAVFGDYDVDGQTSVAMLLRVLRGFGAKVRPYIPRRLEEGYGLSIDALQVLQQAGCTLVISVDCGITSLDEAVWAKDAGLDLIITDHHQPGDTLPEAVSVVNPKIDGVEAWRDLAGVGVAFKVAEGVGQAMGAGREVAHAYVDLVALGTVADVVPLVHENRVLVRAGLARINSDEALPGIRALCDVAGVNRPVRAGHIGFSVAPRLNAVGRIGDARGGLDLLMAGSYDEALPIARELDRANRHRQALEARVVEEATQIIEEMAMADEPSLVVYNEGWHVGVVGIAASRLVEAYYRPAVVLTYDEGFARGSARSIPGFDLYDALASCRDLFTAFGGHKAAAGLTLPVENVPEFQQRFAEVASERLSDEDLVPQLEIDSSVGLDEITLEWIEQLSLLEPFGLGNPTPVFAATGVRLKGDGVGKGGEHLRCTVQDSECARTIQGIGFGLAPAYLERFGSTPFVDVAFTPEVNEWNGSRRPSLRVRDIRPAALEQRPAARLLDVAVQTLAGGGRPTPSFIGNGAAVGARSWSGLPLIDRRGTSKEAIVVELLKTTESILVQVGCPRSVWTVAQDLAGTYGRARGALFAWDERIVRDHRGLLEEALAAPPWSAVAHAPMRLPLGIVSSRPSVAMLLWDLPADPRTLVMQLDALEEWAVIDGLYLAFGANDVAALKERIDLALPDRQRLRYLYRAMEEAARTQKGPLTFEAVVAELDRRWPGTLSAEGVARGIEIFCQVGLASRFGDAVEMRVQPGAKVDLTQSVLYNECTMIRTECWSDVDGLLALSPHEVFARVVAGAHHVDGSGYRTSAS